MASEAGTSPQYLFDQDAYPMSDQSQRNQSRSPIEFQDEFTSNPRRPIAPPPNITLGRKTRPHAPKTKPPPKLQGGTRKSTADRLVVDDETGGEKILVLTDAIRAWYAQKCPYILAIDQDSGHQYWCTPEWKHGSAYGSCLAGSLPQFFMGAQAMPEYAMGITLRLLQQAVTGLGGIESLMAQVNSKDTLPAFIQKNLCMSVGPKDGTMIQLHSILDTKLRLDTNVFQQPMRDEFGDKMLEHYLSLVEYALVGGYVTSNKTLLHKALKYRKEVIQVVSDKFTGGIKKKVGVVDHLRKLLCFLIGMCVPPIVEGKFISPGEGYARYYHKLLENTLFQVLLSDGWYAEHAKRFTAAVAMAETNDSKKIQMASRQDITAKEYNKNRNKIRNQAGNAPGQNNISIPLEWMSNPAAFVESQSYLSNRAGNKYDHRANVINTLHDLTRDHDVMNRLLGGEVFQLQVAPQHEDVPDDSDEIPMWAGSGEGKKICRYVAYDSGRNQLWISDQVGSGSTTASNNLAEFADKLQSQFETEHRGRTAAQKNIETAGRQAARARAYKDAFPKPMANVPTPGAPSPAERALILETAREPPASARKGPVKRRSEPDITDPSKDKDKEQGQARPVTTGPYAERTLNEVQASLHGGIGPAPKSARTGYAQSAGSYSVPHHAVINHRSAHSSGVFTPTIKRAAHSFGEWDRRPANRTLPPPHGLNKPWT